MNSIINFFKKSLKINKICSLKKKILFHIRTIGPRIKFETNT